MKVEYNNETGSWKVDVDPEKDFPAILGRALDEVLVQITVGRIKQSSSMMGFLNTIVKQCIPVGNPKVEINTKPVPAAESKSIEKVEE